MWWGQATLAGFSLLCYTGGRGRASGAHCRLTNQPQDVGHRLSSLCASLLPQPLQQPSEGWSQGVLTARYSCCTPSMSVPKGCKSTLISRTAWMARRDAEPLLLPWGGSSTSSSAEVRGAEHWQVQISPRMCSSPPAYSGTKLPRASF